MNDAAPTFNPVINFPSSHVVVSGDKEVSLKRVKGGVGSQRFEDTDKAVTLPSQVIEQWIDAVLQDDNLEVIEIESVSTLSAATK